jgi:hypothetical protein
MATFIEVYDFDHICPEFAVHELADNIVGVCGKKEVSMIIRSI